ncbi:lateral signaling target protein 2 homolog [Tribolium castaneum]|uniref:Lateral signaling target protein 2 homolog n=1 Tax=Tribolium castaneum TaxID=7070 RepID=D6WZX8_TRICA|nr:PREDICTED: lateral signaling target protein 2 homolog [Tribolium castaneum]EFA09629.1 Lateral signaling target protein 2 homolog-like Protein [Tribolium castaneum]|eukprot:XP_974964.1 PREDICTED: lateral signaling target protein 2 homolog [Tribolium castaneum]
MESLRKWFYRPKRDDKSLLAQFFFADEALNIIANELDSFDGRKDPGRCTTLVNQLRQSQDKVLTITNAIMDVLIGDERANRDFRVKFPEDVLQENLAGQLWFGAECLAAGSSIMNKEAESTAMRPLAKAVTKSLETVRNLLRDTCLRNNTPNGPIKLDSNELVTEMLLESLKIFDKLFAEFELAYVSAMVPVKSMQEYELQELIGVLFSETLQRALKMKLLSQEMVDDCDPALMFTIPRLAIVSGLLIFPSGPLCVDRPIEEMSNMFRPFRTLLHKIRELLWTLNKRELFMLEKLLCDNEQISDVKSFSDSDFRYDFIDQFYGDLHREEVVVVAKGEVSVNKDKPVVYPLETDTPSTSGYLIPNSIAHDIVVASVVEPQPGDSPPDHDSLEVISVAAATLSSILAENESPNDSGVCTENTSLDRSPSLDCQCGVGCKCRKTSPRIKGKGKLPPTLPRKKRQVEDDASSVGSSDTSSFNSNDDEEIALAMQAAQIAEVRSKYRSSEDLIHRLFVCIAGVADQLQTNFASDLRNILKSVFLMNTSDAAVDTTSLEASLEYRPSEHDVIENNEFSVDPNILAQEALFDTNVYFHLDPESEDGEYTNHPRQEPSQANSSSERPPIWIPDVEAPKCMSCGMNFTVVKRRHHCRNCGKVFCARCSSNSVPLPKFGHHKPVRVCNKCFIYNLTPFTM